MNAEKVIRTRRRDSCFPFAQLDPSELDFDDPSIDCKLISPLTTAQVRELKNLLGIEDGQLWKSAYELDSGRALYFCGPNRLSIYLRSLGSTVKKKTGKNFVNGKLVRAFPIKDHSDFQEWHVDGTCGQRDLMIATCLSRFSMKHGTFQMLNKDNETVGFQVNGPEGTRFIFKQSSKHRGTPNLTTSTPRDLLLLRFN